jgi:hypothetical protein
VLKTMLLTRLTLGAAAVVILALAWGATNYQAGQALGQGEPGATGRDKPVPQKQGRARVPGFGHLKLPAPSDVNARGGRGSLLVYALDGDERRVGEGVRFKEVYEDHRWVVVTGVLNHRAIREGISKTLGLDISMAHPNYRRVDVQRQERVPGGAWSDWTEVDRDRNCHILEDCPEVAEERTPPEVRFDCLVDPLPFQRTGVWQGVDVERLVAGRRGGRQEQGLMIGVSDRPAFQKTDVPEIMVRSLDFTVEPGKAYRYRVRTVIEGKEYVGQRREEVGPWSEPTALVSIPES